MTKNLALRVEHQADHLEMIVGRMIPDYIYSTEDAPTKAILERAREHIWRAAELLREAGARLPRP